MRKHLFSAARPAWSESGPNLKCAALFPHPLPSAALVPAESFSPVHPGVQASSVLRRTAQSMRRCRFTIGFLLIMTCVSRRAAAASGFVKDASRRLYRVTAPKLPTFRDQRVSSQLQSERFAAGLTTTGRSKSPPPGSAHPLAPLNHGSAPTYGDILDPEHYEQEEQQLNGSPTYEFNPDPEHRDLLKAASGSLEPSVVGHHPFQLLTPLRRNRRRRSATNKQATSRTPLSAKRVISDRLFETNLGSLNTPPRKQPEGWKRSRVAYTKGRQQSRLQGTFPPISDDSLKKLLGTLAVCLAAATLHTALDRGTSAWPTPKGMKVLERFLKRLPKFSHEVEPGLQGLRKTVTQRGAAETTVTRPSRALSATLGLGARQSPARLNVKAALVNSKDLAALETLYEAYMYVERIPKDEPYICPLYGVMRGSTSTSSQPGTEDIAYLFTSSPRGTLGSFLEDPHSIVDPAAAAAEMTLALEKLHEAGLLHRRVHIDDFYVNSRGHLTLASFQRVIPNPGALLSEDDRDLLHLQLSSFPNPDDDDNGKREYPSSREAPDIRKNIITGAPFASNYSCKSDIYKLGAAFDILADRVLHAPSKYAVHDKRTIAAVKLKRLAARMQANDPASRPSLTEVLRSDVFNGLQLHDVRSARGPSPVLSAKLF